MRLLAMNPARFAYFDAEARAVAGVAVSVYEPTDNRMGYYNRPGAVYQTPQGEVLHPCVMLASVINLDALKGSTGPEIRRDAVPVDRLYSFVFAHEIGHALHDLAIIRDGMNASAEFAVTARNEMYADRFAWRATMGDAPLPYRKGGEVYAASVDRAIKTLGHALGKYGHPNRGEPLPDSWKLKEKPTFYEAA